MKVTLRNMWYMARRFKTATVLNFVGLVVAFAACYLFLTQVMYNHSYNKGLTDYEQLYRVEMPFSILGENKWSTYVSRYLADELAAMPQTESMALLQCWRKDQIFKNDETEFTFKRCLANNEALTTLAPRLLDGTLEWTDEDQGGIIIPASIAMAYFGTPQAAGRFMWNGEDSIVVRGVYEDFPTNSVIQNCIYANMGDENNNNIDDRNYNCYLRLREQIDTAQVKRDILDPLFEKMHQRFIESGHEEYWDEEEERADLHVRIRPITETWFSGVDSVDKGNRLVDMILQLACMLVIIIATINFLNVTLAESPLRIKSINTRLVLGSSACSLRGGLVAETVVTSLAAFIIAVGVCYLLSEWPFINELTIGSTAINDHWLLIAAIGLTAVLIGVMAGIYPAYYATSFQPALVLKGSFGLTPKGKKLRTGLLYLQFTITCLMVVYIAILYLQSHYISHSDYGYQKDEILYCDIREIYDKRDALRSELIQQTGVKDVSYSAFLLGGKDQYSTFGRVDKNHEIQFVSLFVDWHYLRTLGIEVVEGRDFNEHDDNCCIINETARKQWDWVEMDKKVLDNENEMTVIGVCRNIRFASTRVNNSERAMVFYINHNWSQSLNMMNIRLAANTDKAQIRQKIKDICMKLGAQHEPEVLSLDQKFEETYLEEFRFIRQVLVFSVICIIITLIGVFCMTMFETEYRRKEIGIRKVMGSSTQEILMMFCRHYALLLIVSFIFAVPVAYYIGQQWLQSFAERTPIYWWLFPLALLVVGIITLATVIIQSWRTANENPVNSIKNE